MHTGLPIDTQCVLWAWGPPITMAVRQNDGYSWVPSYGMANINVAPGKRTAGWNCLELYTNDASRWN